MPTIDNKDTTKAKTALGEGFGAMPGTRNLADIETALPLEDDTGIEYEIRLKGYLEEHWSDWLGGLEITYDTQVYSLLSGIVPDQAALHGILAQIRDLGLTLISLNSPCMVEEEEGCDVAR